PSVPRLRQALGVSAWFVKAVASELALLHCPLAFLRQAVATLSVLTVLSGPNLYASWSDSRTLSSPPHSRCSASSNPRRSQERTPIGPADELRLADDAQGKLFETAHGSGKFSYIQAG